MEAKPGQTHRTIKVRLLPDGADGRNARLAFEGAPSGLEIDFASQDQSKLHLLFQWLLDEELKGSGTLVLEIDPGVANRTYRKIAESYIEDLNREIAGILRGNQDIVAQLNDEMSM